MSVAFRRESDEEHKEPRFELPLPPGPNLVTARGLALIERRITELDGAVAAAASEDQREVKRREVRYWTTRRATATLAPIPGVEEVAFGSRVTFRLSGNERRVDIVGSDEADPASGRIAFTAPLAAAMIGAAPGDRVDFNGTPDAIEIVALGVANEEPAA